MTTSTHNQLELLKKLAQSPVSEADGKILFSHYAAAAKSDSWNHSALRAFLTDLQAANSLPKVVTDEHVEAAMHELQLSNEGTGVSWIEFKSFLILQSEAPFAYLQKRIGPVPQSVLDRSVVIRRLPAGVDKSHVRDVMANLAGVSVSRVHLVHGEKTTQALVELEFKDESAAAAVPASASTGPDSAAAGSAPESKQSDREAAALSLVIAALNSVEVQGQKLKAQPATEFPCLQKDFKPSPVAVGIAKGVVLAEKFASSAAAFDDTHQISRTVNKVARSVEQQVNAIDEQYKISASIKEASTAVGNKVAEVAAATGVTSAAKSAAGAASSAAVSFAALPVVSSSWNFISSLANKTAAAVDSLSAEVTQLLSDSAPAGEAKRAAPAPIPDEEPVVSRSASEQSQPAAAAPASASASAVGAGTSATAPAAGPAAQTASAS